MPRPKGVPHVLRPSAGAPAVGYRRPTPWHVWVGPQNHGRWPRLHTAETTAMATHVVSLEQTALSSFSTCRAAGVLTR